MGKTVKHYQALGRKIFLSQLQRMAERYEKVESDLLKRSTRKGNVGFQGSCKIQEAFYAYYLEFLLDHGKATNPEGTFFDDEDTKRGISQKFTAFYQPIVNILEAKYPRVEISLHVASEYESGDMM